MSNQNQSQTPVFFKWLQSGPEAKNTRLTRARRNQRVLRQNMKQITLARQNAPSPPPDPLAP